MQPIRDRKRPAIRLFPAIPLIICFLLAGCETPPEERRLSIYRLKTEPTEENIVRIRASLEDPDRDVRATALNALVGLAVADSDALAVAALDDPDGFVRATATKLLGDLGDSSRIDLIGTVLVRDPDPVARQRAAETLTRLGGGAAAPALAPGLTDPMERVRLATVKGLGKLDPGSATEGLIRLMHEDEVWEIRAEAAGALGRTGDPEVLGDLQAALEDPNEFVRTAVTNALRIHEEVRQDNPTSN